MSLRSRVRVCVLGARVNPLCSIDRRQKKPIVQQRRTTKARALVAKKEKYRQKKRKATGKIGPTCVRMTRKCAAIPQRSGFSPVRPRPWCSVDEAVSAARTRQAFSTPLPRCAPRASRQPARAGVQTFFRALFFPFIIKAKNHRPALSGLVVSDATAPVGFASIPFSLCSPIADLRAFGLADTRHFFIFSFFLNYEILAAKRGRRHVRLPISVPKCRDALFSPETAAPLRCATIPSPCVCPDARRGHTLQHPRATQQPERKKDGSSTATKGGEH